MAGRSTLLTRRLLQTAVYWGTPVAPGGGSRTFAAAVEINVRWEDKTEMFVDAQGREKMSRAMVLVGQDVDLGGYLYLGELADLASTPDPADTAAAYEIQAFGKKPDITATYYSRMLWL